MLVLTADKVEFSRSIGNDPEKLMQVQGQSYSLCQKFSSLNDALLAYNQAMAPFDPNSNACVLVREAGDRISLWQVLSTRIAGQAPRPQDVEIGAIEGVTKDPTFRGQALEPNNAAASKTTASKSGGYFFRGRWVEGT